MAIKNSTEFELEKLQNTTDIINWSKVGHGILVSMGQGVKDAFISGWKTENDFYLKSIELLAAKLC